MADTNRVNGAHPPPHPPSPSGFTLKAEPVENLRPLRVVVVGAGFSGIVAAIRIPEKLRNIDLTVYEKNEGLGGVWWLNKYPGVACDIPSHSYQYSFAPNPNWSNLYAPGSEIQQYLADVAERFGATRFIKTRHEVKHCAWDDKSKLWRIKVTNLATGEDIDDAANVLVTARGQLNEPKWPDIPGLGSFGGKVMHSGAWDTGYDFRGKRIAVVGNGSSAIQIIPNLQKVEGASLTCFMRSPTWISSAFGDQGMVQLGLDPKETDFTPEQRAKFASDPEGFLAFRKVFEDGGNLIHDSTLRGTKMQTNIQAIFKTSMSKTLASRPDLAAALIPSFAPGCRRLTPGKGFLESLLCPNVTVITTPIVSINGGDDNTITYSTTTTPSQTSQTSQTSQSQSQFQTETQETTTEKSKTKTTTTKPFDVLICATGFHTSTSPPFPITVPLPPSSSSSPSFTSPLNHPTNSNSQTPSSFLSLKQHWTPHPKTYLTLSTSQFPNLFLLFGPNSAIGFGSLTKILEAQTSYIVSLIRKLQKEDYVSISPLPSRERDFTEFTQHYFKDTVYTQECSSWYKNREGKIVGLWPGSTLHALEVLRSPRWEDWVYESLEDFEDSDLNSESEGGKGDDKKKGTRSGNRLRWLGNGWSVTQRRDGEDGGDPSWYINPEEVEVPYGEKPEENPRYKARPWSY